MKRALIPGSVNRHGVATPTCFCASVSGSCVQGRRCPLRDSELANECAPREEFPTPARTREDDLYRARALRRCLAAAVGAWIAFAFLLWVAAHHH